ncbi:MAG: arginine repressor [Bifidobacteriaceae bacterium]|nr:arginine repressor [Bifidobacteriaceae bacterium]
MHDDSTTHYPSNKAARLSVIEMLLQEHIVTSQMQLLDMLSQEGIEVTQATLSRDLDELNVVKTRLSDGKIAYMCAGGEVPVSGVKVDYVIRQLSDLITAVAIAKNLVVIHTPVAAAQYVASIIDKANFDGVLGTIAGDDTIMMICSDNAKAQERADWLLKITSQ